MSIRDLGFGPLGIIGAGHLGSALALQLLASGIAPDRLLLSTGVSEAAQARLRATGLERWIATNERIAATCPYVFLTLRPRDWPVLKDLTFVAQATIASTIAGVPAAALEGVTRRRCLHVMPSGPDTIRGGLGICSLFPHHPAMAGILAEMGMRVVPLDSEEETQAFTAALCLPAVSVVAQSLGAALGPQWQDMERAFPRLAETFRWAREVAPVLANESDRIAYVERMATKGGITEVIVRSFRAGRSLASSLSDGIARCAEIAAAAEAAR